MRYERKTVFGEGRILAALILLCVLAMLATSLSALPKAETLQTLHELPEGFAAIGKIDINHAAAEELQSLPGVGEALSERIIAYREANGGFLTIEEIMRVSGIGEGIFAEIKDLICVETSCE